MALSQRLLIRQSQALVMTPQLMQAIKLLQLSHVDLASYVEGELKRNPLLERPVEDEPAPPNGEGPVSVAANAAADRPDWGNDQRGSREQAEESTDPDLGNYPEDGGVPAAAVPAAYSERAPVGPGGRGEGVYNLEAFVSAETTLAGHLSSRCRLPSRIRSIG
jgi:RNA polymerase sigma-54 factor